MNPFICGSLEPKAKHNQAVAQLAFGSPFIVFRGQISAEIKATLYIKFLYFFFLLQQTQ